MALRNADMGGMASAPDPGARDGGDRDGARRAALLAFVRLYELGAVVFENASAVHQDGQSPSQEGSSGRRPVVRRDYAVKTALADNIGQSNYRTGVDE